MVEAPTSQHSAYVVDIRHICDIRSWLILGRISWCECSGWQTIHCDPIPYKRECSRLFPGTSGWWPFAFGTLVKCCHFTLILTKFACAAAWNLSGTHLSTFSQDCSRQSEGSESFWHVKSCIYIANCHYFFFQLNILVDDTAKAVLCDFGLSHLKADVTSRTTRPDGVGVVGSRNWMAPEWLKGGSLKRPCNIYAFGMTAYEVCDDCTFHMRESDLLLDRSMRTWYHWVIWALPSLTNWLSSRMSDLNDQRMRMLLNWQMQSGNLSSSAG